MRIELGTFLVQVTTYDKRDYAAPTALRPLDYCNGVLKRWSVGGFQNDDVDDTSLRRALMTELATALELFLTLEKSLRCARSAHRPFMVRCFGIVANRKSWNNRLRDLIPNLMVVLA
jgi:hypothetical protein